MSGEATFRLAQPGDTHLLEEGLKALSDTLGDPYEMRREDLARLMALDPPPAYAVLAERGGLVGLSMFSPVVSVISGSSGAYISDLWVHPDMRGNSLGARLLRETLREANTKWDAQYLSLVVYEDNPRARKFYEREGFKCKTNDRLMILQPETKS